jgi:hypothetical protein
MCVLNDIKLIRNLLQAKVEDNDLSFSSLLPEKMKSIDDSLFLNHEDEGYFKILINRHLFESEIEFQIIYADDGRAELLLLRVTVAVGPLWSCIGHSTYRI